MDRGIKIREDIQKLLQCPICGSELKRNESDFICTGKTCQEQFPIVHGIPVLLNEDNSLFTNNDFINEKVTTFTDLGDSAFKKSIKRLVPSIGINLRAKHNYQVMVKLLLNLTPKPKVLVIGGGVLGYGMEELANHPSVELVETDVSFGPRTQMIMDGHDIPFSDNSFDGVVTQGVLSCVLDPYRCVSEIHRVLKPEGIVYAEMPFMQPVCAGRYDFTRFTYLGFRRLFRRFDDIDSGIQGGPGMGLAWYFKYFLLSFSDARRFRIAVWIVSSYLTFWLKYFDKFLTKQSGSYDAATGVYIIGRKSHGVLSDTDLIKLYKGGFA
jgi:SAM-dependent methyltransferase